jgi:hypothetical protein
MSNHAPSIPWAALLLALAAALGCHETPGSAPEDAGATPPTVPPDGATSQPPASQAAGSAAPDLPAPTLEGSTVKISLRNGATLTMPKGAVESELGSKADALPASVDKTFLFKLGHDKRLLMVTQLKDDGKSCSDYLGEEWAKMKRAKDDPNEKRLEFRRIQRIEDLDVGGTRVLYGETLQRGFFQAEKRPYAAMASTNACRDGLPIAIMFATDKTTLPQGSQAMMTAIMASYTK